MDRVRLNGTVACANADVSFLDSVPAACGDDARGDADGGSEARTDEKCCVTCADGLSKYFSIDQRHDACGESCIADSEYRKYRRFEKNLTKAWSNTPCATDVVSKDGSHFTDYLGTETHGVPGLLSATVDLYGPADR